MPEEHFNAVLKACGMGEFQAEVIRPIYNDALEFIKDAGVDEETALSNASVGCIARYVLDTYSYGAGEVKLSTFFFQRLAQLQAKCGGVE